MLARGIFSERGLKSAIDSAVTARLGKVRPWPWIQWIAGVKQFFDVSDTQGKVSNNEREELVRELRRELGLGGGGGGGRGKSLQVPWQLETGIHFLLEKIGFSA